MGYWKEKMMEDEAREARGVGFVKELIEGGYLEGAALGVAKLWVDKGDYALSARQEHVLKEHVFGPYVTPNCEQCSGDIPWSEMLAAYENGGFCSWCAHQMEKVLTE